MTYVEIELGTITELVWGNRK